MVSKLTKLDAEFHPLLTLDGRRLYTQFVRSLLVRSILLLFAVASAWAQSGDQPEQAVVQDLEHSSQVLGGKHGYRVFLPPAYATSQARYPVIYWFHGYEQAADVNAYTRQIAAYVGTHDAIVVNSGPVETTGVFPLYFPELVDRIDGTLRTIMDRDHRAVSGYLAGGFFALLIAGKYPDLVSSASSFLGPTEYSVGPNGFDVDYNLEDFYGNYDGVRTRLVTETGHFLDFYHRRLNAVWSVARNGHEAEIFDSTEPTPELAKTFDFHLHEFERPSPKPAVFNHADVYPNFTVWGWEVTSARRRPGVTVLEDVSDTGFRSAVREWIPGGATLPEVKLSIASAAIFAPGSSHMVTYLRLRDGYARRAPVRADAQGRLNFELDGDQYQVGISAAPLIAVTGYEIADAAWATAGQPLKLLIKFSNVGAGPSRPMDIRWECADKSVKFDVWTGGLAGLAPGESASVPVNITGTDPARAFLRFAAIAGATRSVVGVPLFPHADATKVFQIADGATVEVMRRAVATADVTFGEGNHDGHAAPGESFAVLVPDGEMLRAAELFTNDACVDNTVRGSDDWSDYDHSGASVKYSLPRIRKDCEPGHVIHFLARVLVPHAPDHRTRYLAIDVPVWWRPGEEPK
jgi:hypothetical protein